MTHTLVIRGVDDNAHEELSQIANQEGLSINSIVKDAVDIWLKQKKSKVPKKHHLIIYSNENSLIHLIKSMDTVAKNSNLYRCFFGPPDVPPAQLMTKLKWEYGGGTEPYWYPHLERPSSIQSQYSKSDQLKERNHVDDHHINEKEIKFDYIIEYCEKVLKNITNRLGNKQICCLDLLMNDISKSSIKHTLSLEKAYNNDRIKGIMYCTYNIKDLLNFEFSHISDLFGSHDQIFVLKDNQLYKLQVTRENIHKLFLS